MAVAEHDLISVALSAVKHGLSPLPVGARDWTDARDGEGLWKHPAVASSEGQHRRFKWKEYQTRPMSETECRRFFRGAGAIGYVMGVTGEEAIDFDFPGAFEDWERLLTENGHDALLKNLVVQSTATAGRFHVLYRCPGHVEGNQDLARRYTSADEREKNPAETIKAKIETRGVGGYVVGCPTPGYGLVRGKLSGLPTLTKEEREALIHAARLLDEVADEPAIPQSQAAGRTGQRPGDDYNARASWPELLEAAGGYLVFQKGNRQYWRRPGKTSGVSATTGNGHSGQDLLKVHTSNWPPFRVGGVYSKFSAHASLNHGGDFAASAKEMGKLGYGEQGGRTTSYPAPTAGQDGRTVSQAEEEAPKAFTFLRWSQLKDRPPKEMLVDGLIGLGDSAMIFGAPKSGKTFTVLDLLLACASGGTWAGRFDVARPMKVVYCTNEGKGKLASRIAAAAEHNDVPEQMIEDNLTIVEEVPQLYSDDSPRAIQQFVRQWGSEPLDLLCIDTLNKAAIGSKENDNSDAAIVCDALGQARTALGCSSLLVHHAGRDGASDRARGASAYDGDMDVQLQVVHEEESGFRCLQFKFAKDVGAFEPVPFKLTPVGESMAASWTVEAGYTIVGIVQMMKASGTPEWGLGQLADALKGDYSAIQKACVREARRGRGLIVQSSDKPVLYRLRGRNE